MQSLRPDHQLHFLYYVKYETLHKIGFIKSRLGNLEQENEFLESRISELEARLANVRMRILHRV